MAELNTAEPKQKGKGKVRSKKMNTFVDLTAMVDLAFLLITFFMLTTTLSKPQSMNLAMPDKTEKTDQIKVDENRTLTLLLGADNKIVWYMGQFEKPLGGPELQSYGKNGLRQLLLDKNRQALAYTQDLEKGLVAIIKASPESTYRNLVDALDEMVITQVKSYAIVDISPVEEELLKEMAGGQMPATAQAN